MTQTEKKEAKIWDAYVEGLHGGYLYSGVAFDFYLFVATGFCALFFDHYLIFLVGMLCSVSSHFIAIKSHYYELEAISYSNANDPENERKKESLSNGFDVFVKGLNAISLLSLWIGVLINVL